MVRWLPWTFVCYLLLTAAIGFMRPRERREYTPKLHAVCQSEKPAYYFGWMDSVAAYNRAHLRGRNKRVDSAYKIYTKH